MIKETKLNIDLKPAPIPKHIAPQNDDLSKKEKDYSNEDNAESQQGHFDFMGDESLRLEPVKYANAIGK